MWSGEPGRTAVKHMLPELKKEHGADFVIVNGENAAAGRGITPRLAQELLHAGVDVITTGTMYGTRRNWLLGWTPNRACCAPSTTRRGHGTRKRGGGNAQGKNSRHAGAGTFLHPAAA